MRGCFGVIARRVQPLTTTVDPGQRPTIDGNRRLLSSDFDLEQAAALLYGPSILAMKRLPVALLVCAFAVAGCMAQVTQSESGLRSTSGLRVGEVYTILDDDKIAGLERSLPASMRDKMNALNPDAAYLPSKDFRDALFPYFEPEIAPKTDQQLSSLLSRPIVRSRIKDLGARFLISIVGTTTIGESEGLLIAGASPGGGGCLGAEWAHKKSDVAVAIWDLEATQEVGTLEVSSEGVFSLVCFGLPIPLISATETAACEVAAEYVTRFLLHDANGRETMP